MTTVPAEMSRTAVMSDEGFAASAIGVEPATPVVEGNCASHIEADLDPSAGIPGMTPDQVAAWTGFLRAHARVMRRLEADLEAAHGMPMAHYDVLVQLSMSPGRRLRMTDLADRVLLSRSGLTRLVDRLERDGFVSRQTCSADHRGTWAVLTDAGRARLREAAPTHLAGVHREVLSKFDVEETSLLGRLLERMAAE